MIELERQSNSFGGFITGIVLIIFGAAFLGAAISSKMPWMVETIPLFFVIIGVYVAFGSRKLFYDDQKLRIVVQVSILNCLVYRRSYSKSDFNAVVILKADDDSALEEYMVTLNGRQRLKFGYVTTKDKIIQHAATLHNVLGLRIEDWTASA